MAETWHSKVEKSVDNLLSPDENSFGGREFFLSFEKFLSIEHFSCARIFYRWRISSSIENLKFLKTIQNFKIDHGQQCFLVPLHNRQNIKANNFIFGRLGKNQPCKVRM